MTASEQDAEVGGQKAVRPAQLEVLADPSGLLAAIILNPEEDTPRLEYADWLDDEGGRSTERAELIRVQCQVARLPWCESPKRDFGPTRAAKWFNCGKCRACRLNRREKKLLANSAWLNRPDDEGKINRLPYASLAGSIYRRGFIFEIGCEWRKWLQRGDEVREREWVPVVRFTEHFDMDVGRFGGQRDWKLKPQPGMDVIEVLHAEWPGTDFALPSQQRVVPANFGA